MSWYLIFVQGFLSSSSMTTLQYLREQVIEMKRQIDSLQRTANGIEEMLTRFVRFNGMNNVSPVQNREHRGVKRRLSFSEENQGSLSLSSTEKRNSRREGSVIGYAFDECSEVSVDVDSISDQLEEFRNRGSDSRVDEIGIFSTRQTVSYSRRPSSSSVDAGAVRSVHQSVPHDTHVGGSFIDAADAIPLRRSRIGWTVQDNDRFIQLYNRGVSTKYIASQLGRTAEQIRGKIKTEKRKGNIE